MKLLLLWNGIRGIQFPSKKKRVKEWNFKQTYRYKTELSSKQIVCIWLIFGCFVKHPTQYFKFLRIEKLLTILLSTVFSKFFQKILTSVWAVTYNGNHITEVFSRRAVFNEVILFGVGFSDNFYLICTQFCLPLPIFGRHNGIFIQCRTVRTEDVITDVRIHNIENFSQASWLMGRQERDCYISSEDNPQNFIEMR